MDPVNKGRIPVDRTAGDFFYISPSKVDTSGHWLFWTEEPSEPLINNVARLGQLEPALLVAEAKGWELVSGYKRVQACSQLGIPLLARETNLNDEQKGLVYFASNFARIFGAAGQAVEGHQLMIPCLRYFQGLLSPEHLSPFLRENFKPFFTTRQWTQLLTWLELPCSWDALLMEGKISLDIGYRLVECLQGRNSFALDLVELEKLFQMVRWSKNNQRQMLDFLVEIGSREGKTIKEVLDQIDLGQDNPNLAPKDRIELILGQLKRIRYPVLSAMQGRFKAINRKFKRVQISPRQHFEQNGVVVQATIGDDDDLTSLIAELQAMSKQQDWQALVTWMEHGFESP